MKRYTILLINFLLLIPVFGQNDFTRILKSIEENNKELQAGSYLTESMKLESKTENNLSDPSVSYEYVFGSPQELGKEGELTISQEFDFPTLYGSRSKLNKLKGNALDLQYLTIRRDILLQAQEICMDLTLLNQQRELLNLLLENAVQLEEIYVKRLDTGDANILELNKIKLELMNVRTEFVSNENERNTRLQELIAMNGNISLDFTDLSYPFLRNLPPYDEFRQEYLYADSELQSLEYESEAARQQITVNKSGWLPKLEVGYRRNTGKGEQFNGFIVGASIPIFENKNKVKIAKAQSTYTDLQKQSVEEQVLSSFQALYEEAIQLSRLLATYDLDLMDNSMALLKKALEARQISMTEYFTELETIYTSRQNYMQLENRYQKIVAQLYKNRL